MQKHYIESLIPYYSNMMPCVLRQYAHSETYQKHPENFIIINTFKKEIHKKILWRSLVFSYSIFKQCKTFVLTLKYLEV